MIAKLMITVMQVSNRREHMKTGIRRIWTLSLTHSMDNRKTGSLSTIHAHSTQTFEYSLAMPSVGVKAFCCFLLVCLLVFILHCCKNLLKYTCANSWTAATRGIHEINLTAKTLSHRRYKNFQVFLTTKLVSVTFYLR